MIYFIFPIYNEEKNILPLFSELKKAVKDYAHKIIAVNDGSSDASVKILSSMKSEHVDIIGSVINMNIGAVFSYGLAEVVRQSKNDDDIVFIMESDQTSEVDLIPTMIDQIEKQGKDVIIASRYLTEGEYQNFPLLRQFFSLGANHLMRFYFPIKDVRDYTIFFRAYRLGTLKKAVQFFGPFGLIQSKGFVANAELLIKLSLFTQKIKEVPFVYNYGNKKGKSKIRVLRTINEYFVLIFYMKRIITKVNKWKDINKIGVK